MNGAGEKILGGWTVSAIQRYTTGTPLGLSVTNNLPISNPGLRPDVVAGVPQRAQIGAGGFDPARDLWINPAAFKAPAQYTFGNTSRYLSSLRSPGGKSESIAIIKDTSFREKLTMQFRTELSNPMNRVVFGGPSTNLSSASFGRVGSAGGPRNIQFGLKLMF